MKPSINILIKGTGGYRKNRYLYGGTGGISLFQYNSYILYDSPIINYDGAFSEIVRHPYGNHICYGGPGGTFLETASQPTITLINKKINTQDQINNVPTLRII